MKTGSAPWLRCAGLPAAAGVARSGDGSCKSWGKVEDPAGWGAQRLLGLQRGPCTPWLCVTRRVGAHPGAGDPLPQQLGLSDLSAMAPALQPRCAISLTALLDTALPSPWLPRCSRSALLTREMPGTELGLAAAADTEELVAMASPSPARLCPCQGSPSAQPGDSLQRGSLSVAAGTLCWVKGTCASAGKLLGSSSKHNGV